MGADTSGGRWFRATPERCSNVPALDKTAPFDAFVPGTRTESDSGRYETKIEPVAGPIMMLTPLWAGLNTGVK
jgi:hypothetical protein